MPIARAALPGIGRRLVPQQVHLMGNEGADGGGHLLEVLWKIPQVLHGLEQDGHTMAMSMPGGDVPGNMLCLWDAMSGRELRRFEPGHRDARQVPEPCQLSCIEDESAEHRKPATGRVPLMTSRSRASE